MFILRAKYLIPASEKAVENGALAIEGARIVAAGKYTNIHREHTCPVIDLGESAILPGLINAHTHLELTSLHGFVKPTRSFINWISKVVKTRLSWSDEELKNSVQNGITMSLKAGVTTLADISATGHAFENLSCSPLRKTIFHEVIDFNPSTAETTARGAIETIKGFNPCDNLLTVGISPHAPYTVSKELYRRCSALSRELNIPICTHIAETKDEIEFLVRGSGGFVNLLRAQNMLDARWRPPGLLPVEYLNSIGVLKAGKGKGTGKDLFSIPLPLPLPFPWMLIHCNYLSDEEMSIIKKSGSSVVFCPRSHRFFGHENHPFRELLSKGINVALGTDSLASNDTLSILDEMRFLYERHTEFPPYQRGTKGVVPQQILAMATINGAKALGMEGKVGTLAEGFEADIAVIEVQGGNPPRPPFVKGGNGGIYDRLFSPASRNILTIVAGKVCYDRYGLMPAFKRIK